MDFALDSATSELAHRVRAFIEAEVIPREPLATHPDGLPPDLWKLLQDGAKEAGIWAPQLPRDLGGLGLTLLQCASVFEEAGRSLLGPRALNCAAPDEGNMHRCICLRHMNNVSVILAHLHRVQFARRLP